MNATELGIAYAEVARKHKLPPMAPAALQVETEDFTDPESAWRALRERKPTEGWLLFQSHVTIFVRGLLPDPDPAWGFLLAAEVIDGNGHSIHVRQSETDGPRLVVAKPTDVAADVNEVFLTDHTRHLATDKAPGPLCHRRYWRIDPAMGVAPVFAAFQGFARQEDV